MPRPSKPWYWKARDGWYATIDGRRFLLAKGRNSKTEAMTAFHRQMAHNAITAGIHPDPTVRDVFNLFLAGVERKVELGERDRVTFEGYVKFLRSAGKAFGGMAASELRPLHVTRWTEADHPRKQGKQSVSLPWGATTRNNAITAVKAAFRWAKRSGYIRDNPIVDMERPTAMERTAIPTPDQARIILEAVHDRAFLDLLTALAETGCRPGELSELTAKGVDLEAKTWTVRNKTRRKTKQPTRVVYLADPMVELSRRLIALHPEGPIFRNMRGRPWTRNAMACRFARLRKKLGMGPEATAYAFRHLYVTDGLERGIPIATMAALVGHSNTTTTARTYSKLPERTRHLHEAARKARGVKPDSP